MVITHTEDPQDTGCFPASLGSRQSILCTMIHTRSYLDLVNSHIKKKCDRSAATLETPKKMIHRGGGSQLTLSYNQPTNENRAISRAQDDRFCRSTINKISENHFCNWSRYETPLNRGLRARIYLHIAA